MAPKDRCDGQPFTCCNRGYGTDTKRGKPHGRGRAKGSVLPKPVLKNDNGTTLWLEHVTGKREGPGLFWLMWYDRAGTPTISGSGVFDAEGLETIKHQLGVAKVGSRRNRPKT